MSSLSAVVLSAYATFKRDVLYVRKKQHVATRILDVTNLERGVEGEGRDGRCEGSCDHPIPRTFVRNLNPKRTR